MSSITENILNTLAEAEAAAVVLRAKADDVISLCRKARKKLAPKVVSTSFSGQFPVIDIKVAEAITKRERKSIK